MAGPRGRRGQNLRVSACAALPFCNRFWAPRLGATLALCAAILIAGCASTSAPGKAPLMWEPNSTWWAQARVGKAQLLGNDARPIAFSATAAKTIESARAKIDPAAGLQYDLGFLDHPLPNAFAIEREGRPKVLLSLGLISLFESDTDVLSFVIGHELAHHALGHVRDGQRAKREQDLQAAGLVLGNVSSFFIPFSGILVSRAVIGIGRSYSRDEERAADMLALQWMAAQGIDICAANRLNERLAQFSSHDGGLMSTHPGTAERIRTVQALAIGQSGRGCDGRK
jgi:Zn-dependent protease with chaperone function